MRPPVYLINLDKSLDRLAISKKRLDEQGIAFERISGVLGDELTNVEIEKHYSYEINLKKYHTALTAGQIGCYLSHRKAWGKVVEGNHPYALILEDDVKFVSDIKPVFETIDSIDFSWDLIKLSAYQSRKRPIAFEKGIANGMKLVVHSKPMTGCAAYLITKTAAEALLFSTERFGRPVDTDIQHFWEKNIQTLSLMPYAIEQDMNFASVIDYNNVPRKKYFWKRKYQQLTSSFKNKSETKKQIEKLQGHFK